MIYEVTTRAGKRYSESSTLTDAEAQAVLAEKPNASDFEKSLAGKKPERLSPKMRAWLHVLAIWAITPREETDGESFPNILAMLTHAREAGKKFPKVKLEIEGQRVVLALSGAGKVNVTDGRGYRVGAWFGAIQPSGAFRQGREYERVSGILRDLESDPAGVAARHGIATGECCFCSIELTTPESLSVGYGPVCAKKHALPWGEVNPDVTMPEPKPKVRQPYC